ncbi:MAG: hypothetical protein LIP09_00855 [Bacteroidales bacterium]|nr:hypothetical protein [Bacteroidales bacterium]
MTNLESLSATSGYPIPEAALLDIAESTGLDPDGSATLEARQAKAYKWAKAKVYLFLAAAPNVSQNGISYSFSAEERKRLLALAKSLLSEIGEDMSALGTGIRYGYRGEDF